MKKDISIKVNAIHSEPFFFGQHVWSIMKTDYKNYRSKCPICDDSRKVEIRGKTFDCPNCATYSSRRDNNATELTIYEYQPLEYIVNEIRIHGEETKSAYDKNAEKNDNRLPLVSYSAFARTGRYANDVTTKILSDYDFRPVDAGSVVNGLARATDAFFFEKKDAKKLCSAIHAIQKEALDRFNAEHGTNYEYPYE